MDSVVSFEVEAQKQRHWRLHIFGKIIGQVDKTDYGHRRGALVAVLQLCPSKQKLDRSQHEGFSCTFPNSYGSPDNHIKSGIRRYKLPARLMVATNS